MRSRWVRARRRRQLLVLGVSCAMVGVAALDVALPQVNLVPFLAVFVLAAATQLPAPSTAVLAVVCLACALAEGEAEGLLDSGDFYARSALLIGAATFAVISANQRVTRETQLRQLSITDPLTGLPNRSVTMQFLQRELSRRGTSQPLAVLFIDLDSFKAVNDHHGHAAGDMVLRTVAARLVAAVRPEDVVTRYGGDEFVIVCTSIQGWSTAESLCERLTSTIRTPVAYAGRPLVVAASIGAVLVHDRTWPAEDLLAQADAAMFGAKSDDRSRYQVLTLHTPPCAGRSTRLAPSIHG